jgi:dihydropteroate synthase
MTPIQTHLRLIEPLGLIDGPAAADCDAAGLALPLAGGPAAFTLARLIEPGSDDRVVAAHAVPGELQTALQPVVRAPAPWGGLTAPWPWVMGVLNVTPDSFSDGGLHLDPERAIAAGLRMSEAGADLIDVGGESTRPGAEPVPPEAERARILPVIRALVAAGVVVSVDTRNAETMAAAHEAGARIVNDVSALRYDPAAAATVARLGCPVILMHMRGVPATMMQLTQYRDVAVDVTRELAESVAAAEAAGIASDRIAIDPGFGFAKGAGQNEALLRRLPLLLNLGRVILVGLSRKGVIGQLSGEDDRRQRMPGSVAAALYAASRGAAMIRVHDVAETVQAKRVWHALTGLG